jgi:hypothetical protein
VDDLLAVQADPRQGRDGHGDFKLLGALGAWLGWQVLPVIVLLSSVVGAVIGITLIVFKGRDHQLPLAFGPYLAIAGGVALFFGGPLVDPYPASAVSRCRTEAVRDRRTDRRNRQRQVGRRRCVRESRRRRHRHATVLRHALTAPGEPGHSAVLAPSDRRSPHRRHARPRELARARFPRIRCASRARSDPASADPRGRGQEMARWTGPTGFSSSRCCSSAAGATRVDRVLVVDCPEDVQVRRVAREARLSDDECARSWRRSFRARERLARADDVIDNSGP